MRTSQNTLETISTIGIDVGKNTFHLVGLDKRGVIVLQQKVTRHQLARRLSNIPRCLIGTETCSGTHFIGCQVTALGHEVRVILLWPWIEQASKRLHRNMALKRRLLRIRGNEAAALSVAHRHHL